MDRFTPSASFRTARPPTRSRNRTRRMSPSPRPNLRRPYTDSVPSTMFITTDCNYDYISSSSSSFDSDLIFSMSPVHSYIPSSPPESINFISLHNKTQKKNSPPPLLYTFPRPTRPQPYAKQNTSTSKDILSTKPLSSKPQKLGALTLGGRPPSPAPNEIKAGPAVQARPLTASLVEPTSPHIQKPKESPPSSVKRHPLDIHRSSPIPIPRHTPRQADPGPFVSNPSSTPLSTRIGHNFECTPLPSSGIASHIVYAGAQKPRQKNASGKALLPKSSAPMVPLRIEGFDVPDSECAEPIETGDEMAAATAADDDSNNARSIPDSAPLRSSMSLGSGPGCQCSDHAGGVLKRDIVTTQNNKPGEKRRLIASRMY